MAHFLLSYIFLAVVTSSSGAPSDDANIDEAVQQSKSSVQDMEKVIMKLKDDLIKVISFQRSNFAELRKNQEEFRSEFAQNKKDMETKMACSTAEGKQCVFPFKYRSRNGEIFEFSHCTHLDGFVKDSSVEKHWCATSTDSNGFYKDWGFCDTRTCKKGFRLAVTAAECTAWEIYYGNYFDLNSCAFECSRHFSGDVFLFGTNEFSKDRCFEEEGCNCWCTNNMKERDCVPLRHEGYNIYVLDEKRPKKIHG